MRGAVTVHDPLRWNDDSVRPSVTATSPRALTAAPTRSRRREPALRGSRTAVIVTMAATTAKGMLTQRIDGQPKKARSTPRRPAPEARPTDGGHAIGHRNVSVMIVGQQTYIAGARY
jgi:hypothetical protein